MAERTFLVVGGNAAGMSAASVAKRRDPSLRVVVLEEGAHVSYSACGIPYWVGGIVEGGADRLVSVTPEQARDARGIDLRLGWSAFAVDAQRRVVRARKPDGAEVELAYDALLLATGTEPRAPFPLPNVAGLFTVRHLGDAEAMRAHLATHSPKSAAVLGAGYVGIEMAEAFLERGIDTYVVLRRRHVLGDTIDPDMSEPVARAMEAKGARLVVAQPEGVGVVDGRVASLRTAAGDMPADVVVVATGVRARSGLAEQAGCAMASGAIRVDDRARTSVDRILAAGDCATIPHALLKEPVHAPLALGANRAGRVAGENVVAILRGEAPAERLPGVLGTAITRFFDLEISRTGLTQAQARAAGFDATSAVIDDVTRAGYFPGSGEARVKLVVERGSGRLLGGQIVGGPGAGKRVDTVALAIHAGLTAERLEEADLAYAPPFSPVWDPVLIAARMATRAAKK